MVVVVHLTVKDESAINTPAVAAAFAIKAYQAQDDTEISLDVSILLAYTRLIIIIMHHLGSVVEVFVHLVCRHFHSCLAIVST